MAVKKTVRGKKPSVKKAAGQKKTPAKKLTTARRKLKRTRPKALKESKPSVSKSVIVSMPEPFAIIAEVVNANTATAKQKDKSSHYVDNKAFLLALVVFRREALAAQKKKLPKPRVPEYIGECFLRIATHLSFKLNFSNYMFREDMVSDGVENCLQYILNFDPAKSSNPFSYFTQIAYFAFLRRIKKEKKQLYIKLVSFENSKLVFPDDPMTREFGHMLQGKSDSEFDRFAREFVDNYEAPKRDRTKTPEPRGLETIMEPEVDEE